MSQSYEVTATVPLTPEEAFALAHTLGPDRTAWDTRVVKQLLLRDATSLGSGAQVFVRLDDGLRLIQEYDLWLPGQLSSTRLIKGPWWLESYGEGWHFTPTNGGTRVTWKVTFHHRLPVFGPQAEQVMLVKLRAQFEARMEDFRAAARDVELIERATAESLPHGARHRDR
ncbi:SRPBCC family protein [Gulosibacter sediminis]|uniref:SRPBCC family protein n=1 Tax=Gulosibacter sediminis TaxID=1729695 RepID=UPI0024A8C9C1|nr:SRPBCC family protein [Gulosibacter sediminis]